MTLPGVVTDSNAYHSTAPDTSVVRPSDLATARWAHSLRNRNSLCEEGGVSVFEERLHLTCARIIDRGGDRSRSSYALAVNEMADRTHGADPFHKDAA